MNRHFILASHGTFADGIANTTEIILGKHYQLHTLCAYISDNEDVSLTVSTLMNRFSDIDELIIITDIFGGSINNEFIKYLTRPNTHLIAGLNLSLVIQLLTNNEEQNTIGLINSAIQTSRQAIQYCNQAVASCSIPDKDF